jgi:hypothetical protein
MKNTLLQFGVGVQLVQHIVLLVVVRCQNDEYNDIFDSLTMYAIASISTEPLRRMLASFTHLLLFLGISFDLFGIPNLLVSFAYIQILVLMQSQLDDQFVISKFQVLLTTTNGRID